MAVVVGATAEAEAVEGGAAGMAAVAGTAAVTGTAVGAGMVGEADMVAEAGTVAAADMVVAAGMVLAADMVEEGADTVTAQERDCVTLLKRIGTSVHQRPVSWPCAPVGAPGKQCTPVRCLPCSPQDGPAPATQRLLHGARVGEDAFAAAGRTPRNNRTGRNVPCDCTKRMLCRLESSRKPTSPRAEPGRRTEAKGERRFAKYATVSR